MIEIISQFEDKKRPDIAIYNYENGKKMLLDITITHPWAVKNLSGSSEKAAFAASNQEKMKNTKYTQKAEALGQTWRGLCLRPLFLHKQL